MRAHLIVFSLFFGAACASKNAANEEAATGPTPASAPESAAATEPAHVPAAPADAVAERAPAASESAAAAQPAACADCEERKKAAAHAASAETGSATAGAAPAAPSGPGACKLATKGKSPVARACASGGIKEAKTVMKAMVKQGKAAGLKLQCDDCHTHEDDFAKLSDDVKEKFKQLLAVYKP